MPEGRRVRGGSAFIVHALALADSGRGVHEAAAAIGTMRAPFALPRSASEGYIDRVLAVENLDDLVSTVNDMAPGRSACFCAHGCDEREPCKAGVRHSSRLGGC
jgi:hypothetical protein